MLVQPHGQKIEVDSFQVYTGGGGSNTAVGFARLGFRTGIVCETGSDSWSKTIMDEFAAEGVDTALIIKEKKEQTGGSVILVAADGSRTVMVYRGAASMLDPADVPVAALSQANWIHLSSIAGQIDTLHTIFAVLAKHHRRWSWNPGRQEIQALVENKISLAEVPCELLIVNREEWQGLEPVQAQLHQQVKYIVITNGREGGQIYQGGSVVHTYTVDPVTVVNETGAGDSFAAGFVAGMLWSSDLPTCVEYGKRNAANVIRHNGAKTGLLTKAQLMGNESVGSPHS